MEIDLAPQDGFPSSCPKPLPERYQLTPWHPDLVDIHAEVKFQSFRFELDANVFPCLGDRDGCRRLMREISRRESFLPGATWLLEYGGAAGVETCGTVQGVIDRHGMGAIQNLGIIPRHRSQGLGTQLLGAALNGFRNAGLSRAYLEVTAQNVGAVRLYERLGFSRVKTVYKAVDVSYA
ncbi:MAG: GNAT family N-acetyltransferase [Planctomycetales bacterium]|nr:GNAT family N-acetyltransferase [Planctomycetales bacterium]